MKFAVGTSYSPAAIEAIARKLATLPDVEYAEPDYMMRPLLTPDDPSYPAQWHYHRPQGINAAAVRVAVIDTGITDHPDLAGRWVGGYDFIADVPTANDGNGLKLDWRASTAAGANNGGLTFWNDGAQQVDLTGVDNGTRGTYFFDAFESRRLTFIGP